MVYSGAVDRVVGRPPPRTGLPQWDWSLPHASHCFRDLHLAMPSEHLSSYNAVLSAGDAVILAASTGDAIAWGIVNVDSMFRVRCRIGCQLLLWSRLAILVLSCLVLRPSQSSSLSAADLLAGVSPTGMHVPHLASRMRCGPMQGCINIKLTLIS